MTQEELDLAHLLINALNLEGKDPATIDPVAPLFGDYGTGWGLDSIDALEIALAIQQRYGIELRADDELSRNAFSSLQQLARFVAQPRAQQAS